MAGIVNVLAKDSKVIVEAHLDLRYPHARTILIPPEASELRILPTNRGSEIRLDAGGSPIGYYHFKIGTPPHVDAR